MQRVLDSCDRQTSLGKRDYAILLLLARLGLRAKEIATLTLDDIDWQSGQLRIRGKGRRRACMRLLREVGRAMAEYLAHGRPHTDDRHVFVRTLAPHIGFASSSAISQIAVSALQRAGLAVRRKGTHIFRHSFAVATLLDWYRSGQNVDTLLPVLSTYLGHSCIRDTYWYLSTCPELMEHAARRLEQYWEASP